MVIVDIWPFKLRTFSSTECVISSHCNISVLLLWHGSSHCILGDEGREGREGSSLYWTETHLRSWAIPGYGRHRDPGHRVAVEKPLFTKGLD